MSHYLDANGYPVDENGHDILEDEFDPELYTDEELGFDDEEDSAEFDDDFDFGLEYEQEYYAESYLTGDSDLGNEY